MTTQQFPDSFSAAAPDTTLNGAITNVATSLIVNTLPAGVSAAPFAIKAESEWMAVTAIGGTGNKTWTVTRGYAGSTPAAHADTIGVYLELLGEDLVKVIDGRTIQPAQVLLTEEAAPSSPASGQQNLYIDSTSHHLSRKNSAGSVTDIETPAATDANLTTSDITTNDVSSTKHGFAQKSPGDATKFLNGAATPAYAQPKDSDLATTDVTTNDASTAKHGFIKKLDNNAAHYMDGTGAWSTPPGTSSPLTTKGDIFGRSTVDARVPIGSDGQVLTADAAQTLGLKWATPSAGAAGALVLLEQHTASASATLDFTTCISSTYDEYLIEFIDLVPSTDDSSPDLRFGTGGGPTFDTGANYGWIGWRWVFNGSGATGANSGETGIALTLPVHKQANWSPFCGSARLFNPASATYKLMTGQFTSYDTAAAEPVGTSLSAFYLSTTAITAFRFFFSAGNVTSGTIRCFGIAKT